jgi:hypothetical protein
MKERSDFVEIEVKVLPDGRDARLVELAGAAAPPGWRMVRKPHVAFFDLYFDTSALTLTATGDHLRVRFDQRSFCRKGRYKLFFKERGEQRPDARWLSRREVRTDLTLDELLQFSSGRIPGLAASLAYESIARAGGNPPLVPVCVISTFRRYFTMRSADPTEREDDILNMGIERSTALAAAGLDIGLLLSSGFIDGPSPGPAYDFELAEAELTVENVDAADEMFARLVSLLGTEFEITTTPKYERCLAELGISQASLNRGTVV